MVASTSVLDSHTPHIFPLYALTSEGHCTCSRGAECRDAGKHPMVRWRHYDDDEKGPAGDFGIPTGVTNGLFVVDVDMKDGKDGGATLAALAAGRVLPETKTVLTPTGGAHLYWKLPPGVYVPNRQALGPGLDVRGEGGYVVGPGSHHKNGGTYEDAGGELADAPAWLLGLVTKPRTSTPSATAHVLIDPKSPAGVRAIEWAKAYLLDRRTRDRGARRLRPALPRRVSLDVFVAITRNPSRTRRGSLQPAVRTAVVPPRDRAQARGRGPALRRAPGSRVTGLPSGARRTYERDLPQGAGRDARIHV